MALSTTTTNSATSTSTLSQINNAGRKRRRSSLGVKRLAELGRGFTTGSSGSGASSNSDSITMSSIPIPSNSIDNYATVSSVHSTSSQTSEMKSTVFMKIQFQITTAPDLEMLPPTPAIVSSRENPLIKMRSNSAMVTSTTSTASSTGENEQQEGEKDNGNEGPKEQHQETVDQQKRRAQLQKLHNQKLEEQTNETISSSTTDDQQRQQQQQKQTSSFKREHRRRPSTTIGVNLDSKGSVSNHMAPPNDMAGSSDQSSIPSSSSSRINRQATTTATSSTSTPVAGHATRSATFGSFSGGDGKTYHQSTDSLFTPPPPAVKTTPRESIYFKRDGQRFGHEFTLKLSVDRSYRCLLKIKPLIPLESICIQGHHIRFHDCTQTSQQSALNQLANHIHSASGHQDQSSSGSSSSHHHHHHRKQNNRDKTTQDRDGFLTSGGGGGDAHHRQPISPLHHLTKHFLHTHSHTHNSGQLIYVFDWSANRFEVNKNKARTEVQIMLKFMNGQCLTLPLQVKFYYSDCRQHLNWGNLLHFIDYDCLMNKMGNMSVNRVQFY